MQKIMKRYLLLILLSLPLCGFAQNSGFDQLYESCVGQEGYRSVQLGRKMMQMMRRDADPQLSSLLDGIRDIRIVATAEPAPEFESRARKIAAQDRYELISQLDDNQQSTLFYFIDGGLFKESKLLMLSFGGKEAVVMNIRGDFDVRDISRLAQLSPQAPKP